MHENAVSFGGTNFLQGSNINKSFHSEEGLKYNAINNDNNDSTIVMESNEHDRESDKQLNI